MAQPTAPTPQPGDKQPDGKSPGAIQFHTCPNKHELANTVKPGIWWCNVCKAQFFPGSKGMYCQQCDFDVCRKCYVYANPSIWRACQVQNGGHMFYLSGRPMNWFCNVCRDQHLATEGVYSFHCCMCDYDMCPKCAAVCVNQQTMSQMDKSTQPTQPQPQPGPTQWPQQQKNTQFPVQQPPIQQQFPQPGQPGQFPQPGPTQPQFPQPRQPGPMQPGQFPQPGQPQPQPGQFPQPGKPQFPQPGQPQPQPGQSQLQPGLPGQFPQPGQPGQFPQPGQPGPMQPQQFPQPGQAQPQQFPQPGQPGQFPQPGQPSIFQPR